MTNALPSVLPIPKNEAQKTAPTSTAHSTHLQLCRCYFEDELHHRADGQTSRAGRVDLIPDSVAVHLRTQTHMQSWDSERTCFLKGAERKKKKSLWGTWRCGLQYLSVTVIIKLWGHLKSFSFTPFLSIKLSLWKWDCWKMFSLTWRENNKERKREAVTHI